MLSIPWWAVAETLPHLSSERAKQHTSFMGHSAAPTGQQYHRPAAEVKDRAPVKLLKLALNLRAMEGARHPSRLLWPIAASSIDPGAVCSNAVRQAYRKEELGCQVSTGWILLQLDLWLLERLDVLCASFRQGGHVRIGCTIKLLTSATDATQDLSVPECRAVFQMHTSN